MPAKKIGVVRGQGRLGPEDNEFGRTPAGHTFRQAIDVSGLPVFETGSDPCQERIAVDEFGTRAELPLRGSANDVALRADARHVEVGGNLALLQLAARIYLKGFRQGNQLPPPRHQPQFRLLELIRKQRRRRLVHPFRGEPLLPGADGVEVDEPGLEQRLGDGLEDCVGFAQEGDAVVEGRQHFTDFALHLQWRNSYGIQRKVSQRQTLDCAAMNLPGLQQSLKLVR